MAVEEDSTTKDIPDDEGVMNKSVTDANGDIIVVSFTLFYMPLLKRESPILYQSLKT